jgi:hypothetical protein
MAWVALLILGLLLPISVVWSVRFPGQHDSYNHLARHYLELLHFEGQPLPPGMAIEYRLVPNLGGDLAIPPLIWLFGPLPALKVFLTLSIVLHWLGPAIFILQTGRLSAAAWIATLLFLPLIYFTFFWGYLNYYSGVGLAFLAAVHLRHLDRQDKPAVTALLLHAALLVLLFLWHLAAIFIYGVVLVATIITKLLETCRTTQNFVRHVMHAVLLSLPIFPAVGLYLIYVAAYPHDAAVLSWPPLLRKILLPLSIFHGYDLKADVLFVILWAAAALLLFGRSLRLGQSWFAGQSRFAALATIMFAVSYAVLPLQIGAASGADARVIPALVVCALAWLGTMPARWSWPGVVLLGTAIVVRAADMSFAWHRLDARLRGEARSFAYIQRDASVLPLILISEFSKEHPEIHFASLAVIERHAYVSTLFSEADQQPLRLTGETRLVSSEPLLRLMPLSADRHFTLSDPAAANYDYLWIYNPERATLALPREWERVFTEGRVTLWHRHSNAISGRMEQ